MQEPTNPMPEESSEHKQNEHLTAETGPSSTFKIEQEVASTDLRVVSDKHEEIHVQQSGTLLPDRCASESPLQCLNNLSLSKSTWKFPLKRGLLTRLAVCLSLAPLALPVMALIIVSLFHPNIHEIRFALHENYGNVFEKAGDYSERAEDAKHILSMPSEPLLHDLALDASYENGAIAEAEAQALGLSKAHPESAIFYLDRGCCRVMQGHRDQLAVDSFKKALKLSSPNSIEHAIALGRLANCGQYDLVESSWPNQENALLRDTQISLLEHNGEVDKLKTYFSQMDKTNPTNEELFRRALFRLSTGEYDLAQADLNLAASGESEDGDKNPVFLVGKAWLALYEGADSETLSFTNQCQKLLKKKSDPVLKYNLSAACNRIRKDILERKLTRRHLKDEKQLKIDLAHANFELQNLYGYGDWHTPPDRTSIHWPAKGQIKN